MSFDIEKNRGFSLIETLICIVILSILLSISLPVFWEKVDKSKYAQAKVKMSEIEDQLMIHYIEKGYFPYDTPSNTKPKGIEIFPLKSDGNIPFNSRFGYDSWPAENGCFIKINFYGKDDRYNGTLEPITDNEQRFSEDYGDDLYLILGTFPVRCQPVPG